VEALRRSTLPPGLNCYGGPLTLSPTLTGGLNLPRRVATTTAVRHTASTFDSRQTTRGPRQMRRKFTLIVCRWGDFGGHFSNRLYRGVAYTQQAHWSRQAPPPDTFTMVSRGSTRTCWAAGIHGVGTGVLISGGTTTSTGAFGSSRDDEDRRRAITYRAGYFLNVISKRVGLGDVTKLVPLGLRRGRGGSYATASKRVFHLYLDVNGRFGWPAGGEALTFRAVVETVHHLRGGLSKLTLRADRQRQRIELRGSAPTRWGHIAGG